MSAKPWIRHYDKGVPHTLHPYPEETLVDVLHRSAVEQPLQPALYFKGEALSYVEMERQSDALAGALLLLGIARATGWRLSCPTHRNCSSASLEYGKLALLRCP